MQGIYIDLILLAVIIIFGIIGVFKGFFSSLLSLFGFFGSIIVAYLLRDQIASLINSWFGLGPTIESGITAKLGEMSESLVTPASTAGELNAAINASSLNAILKGIFTNLINNADFSGGPLSIAMIVSPSIANLAVTSIGVSAGFLIIRILAFVLNLTIGKMIKKGRVSGKVNKWLGLVTGMVKGVLVCGVLLAITSVICLIPSVSDFMNNAMADTVVAKYAYNFVNGYIQNLLAGLV